VNAGNNMVSVDSATSVPSLQPPQNRAIDTYRRYRSACFATYSPTTGHSAAGQNLYKMYNLYRFWRCTCLPAFSSAPASRSYERAPDSPWLKKIASCPGSLADVSYGTWGQALLVGGSNLVITPCLSCYGT